MTETEDVKENIYSSFANTASSIGYSKAHGRIIAALMAKGNELSLKELAEETNYSHSSISASLDLLELFGIITKFKKSGDRKLYIRLDGDLLEGLKKAIVMGTQKKIQSALAEYEKYGEELENLDGTQEKEKIENTLKILRQQLNRLDSYIEDLSEVKIPEE